MITCMHSGEPNCQDDLEVPKDLKVVLGEQKFF